MIRHKEYLFYRIIVKNIDKPSIYEKIFYHFSTKAYNNN